MQSEKERAMIEKEKLLKVEEKILLAGTLFNTAPFSAFETENQLDSALLLQLHQVGGSSSSNNKNSHTSANINSDKISLPLLPVVDYDVSTRVEYNQLHNKSGSIGDKHYTSSTYPTRSKENEDRLTLPSKTNDNYYNQSTSSLSSKDTEVDDKILPPLKMIDGLQTSRISEVNNKNMYVFTYL